MAFLDETGLQVLVGHIKDEIAAVVSEKSHFEGDLTVGGTLTVGGNPMADQVVTYGASGIWEYVKYANGWAMCWGTEDLSTTVDVSLGQFNISARSVRHSYPFPFKTKPIVAAGAYNDSNAFFTILSSSGSITDTPYVNAGRPAGAYISTATSITFGILAIGRWK